MNIINSRFLAVRTLLLSVLAAAAFVVVHGCNSNFHATLISTTVNNPPIGPIDIMHIPERARHYQIDCVVFWQGFPVSSNRQCASPPNQRLQLCHTPVESKTESRVWVCQDISQFLTTDVSQVVVGSANGPELMFKIMWSSSLTAIECFPRAFHTHLVGLAVPEPGTELGASIGFIVVVGVIALAVVAYGFYALWRVSKKFEHREDDHESGGSGGTMPKGGPQEAYRAALRALGAPAEFGDSLYDEGGGAGGGEVPDGVNAYEDGGEDDDEEGEDDFYGEQEDGNFSSRRQQQQPKTRRNQPFGNTASTTTGQPPNGGRRFGASGLESIDANDDEDDYDEEESVDDDDGNDDHSRQEYRRRRHNNNGGVTSTVLDNNQVVHSVAAPVPWFQREQQQQQRHQQQQQQQSVNRSLPFNSGRQTAGLVYSDDEERSAPRHALPPRVAPPPPAPPQSGHASLARSSRPARY